MRVRLWIASVASALLAPAIVLAQQFPGKLVRIVIPFSPGGSNPQAVFGLRNEG